MRQETIFISGMSSGDCVNTVRKALAAALGIYVDAVTMGSATVSYDASLTTTAAIAEVVRRAGYVPVRRVPLLLSALQAAAVVGPR